MATDDGYEESQQTIGDWGRKTFKRVRKEMLVPQLGACLTNLVEAVCSARRKKYKKRAVQAAAGSLLIQLYQLADRWQFDLHEEVDRQMRTQRDKSWVSMPHVLAGQEAHTLVVEDPLQEETPHDGTGKDHHDLGTPAVAGGTGQTA